MAILIDGDNAESGLIADYITEAGRFGKVTIKRIYADWTMQSMSGWKEKLNDFAVRPIQKFSYTKAKSSTDTALIIDAMDLLHSQVVDGFCIVSSDSDYTGLAHRIREEGMFIMGIGRSHTPSAFVKACERFLFSEILIEQSNQQCVDFTESVSSELNSDESINPKHITSLTQSNIKRIDEEEIDAAFKKVYDVDIDAAMMSRFSEALRQRDPSFDPRNFGYTSFRKFCESLAPNYEVFSQGTRFFIRDNKSSDSSEVQ